MIKRVIAALATLLAMAGAFAYGYRAASVQRRPVPDSRAATLHGWRTPMQARETHAIDTHITATPTLARPASGVLRRPAPPAPGMMLAAPSSPTPTASATSIPAV